MSRWIVNLTIGKGSGPASIANIAEISFWFPTFESRRWFRPVQQRPEMGKVPVWQRGDDFAAGPRPFLLMGYELIRGRAGNG